MRNKQLLIVSLCLVLAAGTLFASGGSQPQAAATDPNKPMVITWIWGPMAPVGENPYMIQKWNEMFNVDIQVTNILSTNYWEQINLKFAANEIPDVFRTDLGHLPQQVQQQVVAEIPQAIITENFPIAHREYTELYPNYLKLTTFDNKIYAMISEMDKPYRAPIVYRGDWIKNVGKTGAPKTLAEFQELMYLFTNNDPDKNRRKDTYGLSVSAFDAVYGAYGYIRRQWNNKNGQLVYSSIQPEMKEALGVLTQWYKDGVIDPEFITGENKGGYWAVSHAFTEGRIGVSGHGAFYHWDAPDNNRANIKEMEVTNPQAASQTVLGEPFTGPQGKSGVSMRNALTGGCFAFGKQVESDHAKMAKVLQMENYFCSTPELYITSFYGIKGQDWDYNPAMNNAPMQLPGKTNEYVYSIGAGTTIRPFVTPSGEAARNASWANFCPPNNLYSGGYQNELLVTVPAAVTYLTELNKLEDEAYIAIITGEQPLSYFDRFVAEWKAAGGDTMTKEANDWYNSIR